MIPVRKLGLDGLTRGAVQLGESWEKKPNKRTKSASSICFLHLSYIIYLESLGNSILIKSRFKINC